MKVSHQGSKYGFHIQLFKRKYNFVTEKSSVFFTNLPQNILTNMERFQSSSFQLSVKFFKCIGHVGKIYFQMHHMVSKNRRAMLSYISVMN